MSWVLLPAIGRPPDDEMVELCGLFGTDMTGLHFSIFATTTNATYADNLQITCNGS